MDGVSDNNDKIDGGGAYSHYVTKSEPNIILIKLKKTSLRKDTEYEKLVLRSVWMSDLTPSRRPFSCRWRFGSFQNSRIVAVFRLWIGSNFRPPPTQDLYVF